MSLCVKALHHQLKLINKDSSVLGPVSQPPLAVWSYLPLICHPSVVEHIVVLFIIIAFCIKHYICSFQCCQMKILCTQKEKKSFVKSFTCFVCFFFNKLTFSIVDTKCSPRHSSETSICFVPQNTNTMQELFGFFVKK